MVLALQFLHTCSRGLARRELALTLLAAPLFFVAGRWVWPAVFWIALLWGARRLASGRWTARSVLNAPVCLLAALGVLGLLVSPDPITSLAAFRRLLFGAALYFALLNGVRTQAAWRWLGWGLWAACLGVTMLTLLGTQWGAVRLMTIPMVYDRLPAVVRDLDTNSSFNPRVMGMALGMLFPLPLTYALWGQGRAWRFVAGLLGLVMAPVVLLTQSIQALLGIAAALWLLGVWRRRWALLALPTFLGCALCIALVRGLRPIAEALLSYNHPLGIAVTLRLDIWSRALAMIRAMPWTGIGLDMFPLIQSQFFTGYAIGPEPHAHNLYLQIALDTGVWGLLAFLWLLAAFVQVVRCAYRRSKNAEARVWLVGLAAGVFSCAVSGVVDTLWTSKPAVLLWALLGMAAAMASHQQAEDPARNVGAKSRAIARLGVGTLFVGAPIVSLLLAPGARELNWGRLVAHRAVLESRILGMPPQERLASAVEHLQRSMAYRSADAYTEELLGSVYAWLGEDQGALEALQRRVALDGQDPMARYAPFVVWQRRLRGEQASSPWEDAMHIYGQWASRFPQRAEIYVQEAMLWHQHGDDSGRAQAVLQAGLDKMAQPQHLLVSAQSYLAAGARNMAP